MTASKPRILFVSHQATLTGAPLVLLRLIEWMQKSDSCECEVLLLDDGPLRGAFEQVAPVRCIADWSGHVLSRAERALYHYEHRILGGVITAFLKTPLRRMGPFDLIYMNSAASVTALKHLRIGSTVKLIHVHELDTGLKHSLSPSVAALFAPLPADRILARYADHVIAPAACVRDALVRSHGVDPEQISIHPEFIDVREAASVPPEAGRRRRDELGIPADAPIIVGAGTTDWRKGPDLFLQMAQTIHVSRPDLDVRFVWVGGEADGPTVWPLLHDIDRLALRERVYLVPANAQRLEYFAMGDVFALTSREDPFPLVCLESSILGLPIVSFDNGGMREFLTEGSGFLVDYLDVDAMSRALVKLIEDPDLRQATAQQAAAKVRSHHDVSVVAPRLEDEIVRASRRQHAGTR